MNCRLRGLWSKLAIRTNSGLKDGIALGFKLPAHDADAMDEVGVHFLAPN